MSVDSPRSFLGRLTGTVIVILLFAVLLHSARGTGESNESSFLRSLAVASLIALTTWAVLTARSRIRKQSAAAIELLPPQPGDIRRLPRILRGGGTHHLSDELAGLHSTVQRACASKSAYEEHLGPILRRIASHRGQASGVRGAGDEAQLDLEELLSLGRRLPEATGARALLMRVPAYRRRIITHAISQVIADIEEI